MMINSNVCPKCGDTISGKLSCCARGGAWFNKCGDADDTKFKHTWVEGIWACEGVISTISVKSPRQVMLHNVAVIAHPLNSSNPEANINRSDSVTNAGSTDHKDCVAPARVFITVRMLLIVLFLQAKF